MHILKDRKFDSIISFHRRSIIGFRLNIIRMETVNIPWPMGSRRCSHLGTQLISKTGMR